MADVGRAAVFVGPNKPFELRDYPIPKLEPGSMLVKIAMSNICGSDLHIFRGDMASAGFDGSREAILGHEMAGRVYALGEGAGADSLGRPVKEGDRIVYQYFQPCWSCPICLSGVTRACPNKSGRTSPVGEWPYFTGGYGEYYYVPPGRKLFKVEDDRIPDGLIASVNCAFSQVTQGWETVGLRFGQSAVVQGAGGLGLFATVVAKEIGAAPIIVIDAIAGTLDVELSEAELEKRRAAWKPRQNEFGSGALWRYAQTVGPAVNGAVTHPGAKAEGHVYADI